MVKTEVDGDTKHCLKILRITEKSFFSYFSLYIWTITKITWSCELRSKFALTNDRQNSVLLLIIRKLLLSVITNQCQPWVAISCQGIFLPRRKTLIVQESNTIFIYFFLTFSSKIRLVLALNPKCNLKDLINVLKLLSKGL